MKVQCRLHTGHNSSRVVGPVRDARVGYERILEEAIKSLGTSDFQIVETDSEYLGQLVAVDDDGRTLEVELAPNASV